VPDLTVVVDVSAAEGRRRRGDVHDRLEAEEDTFHEAIRAHYLAMAQGNPQRYVVVDGTLGPDEIHAQVVARLRGMGVLP
jgi:dTMP kinase